MTQPPVSQYRIIDNTYPYCTVEYFAQYSPSIELLSYHDELKYRTLVCSVCIDIVRMMQYSTRIQCTATRLIQIYYLRHKIQLHNNNNTISGGGSSNSNDNSDIPVIDCISMSSIELVCCAILLSSKIEYQPRKLTDYLNQYIAACIELHKQYETKQNHSLQPVYNILCKYQNNYNNEMNNFRDTVVSIELLLYCTVEYNTEYYSIIEYTLLLVKQLLYREYDTINTLQHKSMTSYIHNIYRLCLLSLRSTIYLHYHLQAISVTIIYCIDQLHSDINIQSIAYKSYFISNNDKWYEACGVYAHDIVFIIQSIIDVCDSNDELIQQINNVLPRIKQSLQQQPLLHSAAHHRHNKERSSRSYNRSPSIPHHRDDRIDYRNTSYHTSTHQRDHVSYDRRHNDDRRHYHDDRPYYNDRSYPHNRSYHSNRPPHYDDRRYYDDRSRQPLPHTNRSLPHNDRSSNNNLHTRNNDVVDSSSKQPSITYNRAPPTNQYSGPIIQRVPIDKTDQLSRQRTRQ